MVDVELLRTRPAVPADAAFPFHAIVPLLVNVPEAKMRNPFVTIVMPLFNVGEARNTSRVRV